MREQYTMPKWAVVGAKVIGIHYYSSSFGNPYSEGIHMTISRVLKTQMECEYHIPEQGKRPAETKRRKFTLGRNGFYEAGNKYNPDQLAPEGGKWILSIRAAKEVEQHQRLIRATAHSFGSREARWMEEKEVDEFQKKISDLAVTYGELLERQKLISEMDKDEILAV